MDLLHDGRQYTQSTEINCASYPGNDSEYTPPLIFIKAIAVMAAFQLRESCELKHNHGGRDGPCDFVSGEHFLLVIEF